LLTLVRQSGLVELRQDRASIAVGIGTLMPGFADGLMHAALFLSA